MAAAIPAAIGVGGSIIGGIEDAKSQRKANAANAEAHRRSIAEYDSIFERLAGTYGEAERTMRGGLGDYRRAERTQRQGTRRTLGALGAQGAAARREIRRQGREAEGRTRAAMLARGLGDSSVGDQAQSAVGSNIARLLSGSYADEGAQRAGVLGQGTEGLVALLQGRAGFRGGLANLLRSRGVLEADLGRSKADTIRAVQHTATPSNLGVIANQFSKAAGGLAGLF